MPRTGGVRDPKAHEQPMRNPGGSLTQNGRFYEAAKRHKDKGAEAERVKVYEKIHSGIWTFNGVFGLADAWLEKSEGRKVFKFRLELTQETAPSQTRRDIPADLVHNRMIPSAVKLNVWKRDKGRCVQCGSTDNLHFDHIIPYSKGGTSLKAENIQLLCARHNLEKRDRIS